MFSGRALFFSLFILGVMACWIFWEIPGNQYEWMQSDPVVGDPSARLPEDPDAWETLVLFAVPPLVIALANLANALLRLQATLKILAIGFSVILLMVVIVKLSVL